MQTTLRSGIAETEERPAITVVLVDDHVGVLDGLERLFGLYPDIVVCARCVTIEHGLQTVLACPPDVVLLDLHFPGHGGLDFLRMLQQTPTSTRVIVLTAGADEDDLGAAIHLGAAGIVFKDAAPWDLPSAIRHVHAGQTWLT